MLIFHSYVSLPEGNGLTHKNMGLFADELESTGSKPTGCERYIEFTNKHIFAMIFVYIP